jgi:hypothetical protein
MPRNLLGKALTSLLLAPLTAKLTRVADGDGLHAGT